MTEKKGRRTIRDDAPRGEVQTRFLASLLRSRPDRLDGALRLAGLEPYLRIANSYYWLAHVAGEGVRVSRDRLGTECARLYGLAPWMFVGRLRGMLRKGALVRDGMLVAGRDDVLGPLLERDFEDWTEARQTARGRPRKGPPPPRRAGPAPPRPGRGLSIDLTLMDYLGLVAMARGGGRVTVRGAVGQLIRTIPEEDGAEGEGTA